MKHIFSSVALLLLFFCTFTFGSFFRGQNDDLKEFLIWMETFNHTFSTQQEFLKRFEIFSYHHQLIKRHNSQNLSWKMGHNEFSHLTLDEFRDRIGYNPNIPHMYQKPGTGMRPLHQVSQFIPDSVDWVDIGGVTEVKDQGSCGSCWSFSTTGCMEGAYFVKTGFLKSFSEQQLVSCDTTNYGCNGGLMDYAFEWIQLNGGICLEQDYPYISGDGININCERDCTVVEGTTPMSWVDVEKSENALLSAVAKQPVSAAIEADELGFRFYKSGILASQCGENLDHGILIVGYGTDDGTKYWKVKNSWGSSWGENGYIRLVRGKEENGGQCGILLSGSFCFF